MVPDKEMTIKILRAVKEHEVLDTNGNAYPGPITVFETAFVCLDLQLLNQYCKELERQGLLMDSHFPEYFLTDGRSSEVLAFGDCISLGRLTTTGRNLVENE